MSEIALIIASSSGNIWVLGVIAAVIVGVFSTLYIISPSSGYVQVELSSTELTIKDRFYGRSIALTSLIPSQSLVLDLSQNSPRRLKWRLNGIGLPNYKAGWFRLRNGETALVFLINPHWVVYIPTNKNYSLLISVEEPERLLKSLLEKNS